MANVVYPATNLTGGTNGALDSYDGDNLVDGDAAIVITSSTVYHYTLDDDLGSAESSPDIIAPDDNPGDKRWVLVTYTTNGLDTGIADDDIVQIDDADTADNDYAKFTANGLEGRSYAEVQSDIAFDEKFYVYIDTAQSLAADTYEKLEFDAEVFDIGNDFDNSSNYRFTAPANGYFVFTACVSIGAVLDDGEQFNLVIKKNGNYLTWSNVFSPATDKSLATSNSIVVYCETNDYVEVFAKQTDAAAQNTLSGVFVNFTGHRLS